MEHLFSIIITVFRSEKNLPPLLEALDQFARENKGNFNLECVFVVDGSPDRSFEYLKEHLPLQTSFRSQLLNLSRNFGAPFAVRCGLEHARGDNFINIAADLQDPLEAVKRAYLMVRDEGFDICFGRRVSRRDPWHSKLLSGIFWTFYTKLIQPAVPPGGVDFCAFNRRVRDQILSLREKNVFLIGLFFWVGYRRTFIPYHRSERKIGKSSWSLRKRLNYFMDSLFAFSNLPIKLLIAAGGLGILLSVGLSISTIISKLSGSIPVRGYSMTVILISFFGGLNSFGLGIIGEYVWRIFENTKSRPLYIVMDELIFEGAQESRETCSR